MSKIAVIKTGGKQYKVKEGETVKIEKLDKNVGDEVVFDTLLISDEAGKELNLGAPSLGDKVKGQITKAGKSDKVTVVKYKNKIRYKRTLGHRQNYMAVKITSIA